MSEQEKKDNTTPGTTDPQTGVPIQPPPPPPPVKEEKRKSKPGKQKKLKDHTGGYIVNAYPEDVYARCPMSWAVMRIS